MTDEAEKPIDDTSDVEVAGDPVTAKEKKKKEPFRFTDHGCRTEVRLGALLTVGAIFLWMWLGPNKAVWMLLMGVPLLWVGVVIQAIEARRDQRPGYPMKLGIVFAVFGGLMIPDQMSRVVPDGALSFQIQAPLLCLSGLWIIAWWFYTRGGSADSSTSQTTRATEGMS